MLIQQIAGKPASAPDPNLHKIVTELIEDAASVAMHNRNLVINEIPDGLRVEANQGMVAGILSKLVNTVLRHTKNSGILISAKVYGFVILVQVKTNGLISPHLIDEMQPAAKKAEKTGGVIELIHHQENQASVAYCFLNVAGQA